MKIRTIAGTLLLLSCVASCSDASPRQDDTSRGASHQPASTNPATNTSPSTVQQAPPPLDVAPAPKSPALDRFSRAAALSALAIANKVAYYSVADPALLAHTTPHASLGDYASITPYLAPTALAVLRKAISGSNDGRGRNDASALALASYSDFRASGTRASKTNGTKFDVPFSPHSYHVKIDPSVAQSRDRQLMVVSGSCTVRIPGTRNGTPYDIELKRTSFQYFFSAGPSRTEEVRITGWTSQSDALYHPR